MYFQQLEEHKFLIFFSGEVCPRTSLKPFQTELIHTFFFLIAFILYHYSLKYVFTQLNQKKSNGKKYYRSKLNKKIMLIITADITTIFS